MEEIYNRMGGNGDEIVFDYCPESEEYPSVAGGGVDDYERRVDFSNQDEWLDWEERHEG